MTFVLLIEQQFCSLTHHLWKNFLFYLIYVLQLKYAS